jgi:hypothetical protein
VRARVLRASVAASAACVCLLAAGSASAATTKNFTFKSNGSATTPSSVSGDASASGSHQDFPFVIKPSERDGVATIAIHWTNPADDWDLYVYRKTSKGTLETVGNSAGGPPSTDESAPFDGQGLPIKPGNYVIRVVNYLASDPTAFTGFARFDPYVPPNRLPVAKLKAPKHAKAGKKVTLDASKSKDPDGRIVDYAFDLNGDGAIDVDTHSKAKLKRSFKPGIHHVTVRVTDNKGARAYSNATITVRKH